MAMLDDPFQISDAPSQLPRGPHSLGRDVVEASQRGRLLVAFVETAGEKGFNAVTIQDIVTRAGTAKRTFYEHFEDKDDCFREAFEVGSAGLVAAVVNAAEPIDDPIERIEAGVRAYLEYLSEHAVFSRFFLTAGPSANAELVELWISWVEALADVLVLWRAESRETNPEVPEMTKLQAQAVLSAINEVARIAVVREGVESIPSITDELVELVIAMLTIEHVSRG
jgi:AcrR family transcriptional regulator